MMITIIIIYITLYITNWQSAFGVYIGPHLRGNNYFACPSLYIFIFNNYNCQRKTHHFCTEIKNNPTKACFILAYVENFSQHQIFLFYT